VCVFFSKEGVDLNHGNHTHVEQKSLCRHPCLAEGGLLSAEVKNVMITAGVETLMIQKKSFGVMLIEECFLEFWATCVAG
jgi:hypothetical protein